MQHIVHTAVNTARHHLVRWAVNNLSQDHPLMDQAPLPMYRHHQVLSLRAKGVTAPELAGPFTTQSNRQPEMAAQAEAVVPDKSIVCTMISTTTPMKTFH